MRFFVIKYKITDERDTEETIVKGKRRINLASIWIIVIFTVIAVTLLGFFVLVYSSILNREMTGALREEVSILSDNADHQIMEALRSEPARRLSARDGFAEAVRSISEKGGADSARIRAMAGWCAAVSAAVTSCDRVVMYFPGEQTAVGSDGAHFLNDKKYTVQESVYAFLTDLDPESPLWLRQLFTENGEEVPYIVYAGPMPGIFPGIRTPMIMTAVREDKLHTLFRRSLRTLTETDMVFLADTQGVIRSAEDVSLVGTTLPIAQPSGGACRLQDGREVMLAESSSGAGGFVYVLARPASGWLRDHSETFSILAVVCLVLLGAGLVAVLWVLMAHYSRPMRRLIGHFAIPENTAEGKSLVASPIEHFSRIETALRDMSDTTEKQTQFLEQNHEVLRSAWLDCLMSGEAHYTGPMPQLGIDLPYPYFQVVMLSDTPAPAVEEAVLACFPEGFKTAAFTTRQKERVFLINHGADKDAVPRILEQASEVLDEKNIPLIFGVGILAETENRVQVSYRCARRALSGRYFGDSGRVFVFEAKDTPGNDQAMSEMISRLFSLSDLIRRQAADEVNEEIDAVITRLKEDPPYLNIMRGVMLTAAMLLCKIVYDMKGVPEDVFGCDLMNTYYHIEDIGAFSTRLKEDSMTLIAYLSRESSESNQSVVRYAMLHIRNTPPAELSTQSIADALSISTGHLSRVFHQETGKKLVDYLQEVRMEHAARLIRETRMTNEQVCETIGYSRLQYFNAKFREYYGMSLNDYRRRCRAEQDAPADDPRP